MKPLRWLPRCLLLVFVAALPAVGSRAQAPGGKAETPPDQKREFTIYHLKNSSAVEIARYLQEVYGTVGRGIPQSARDLRIVADERTNSLLFYAPRAEKETVEAILKLLDREGPGRDDRAARQVGLVPLTNLTPTPEFEKALRLVYQGSEGKFALDKQMKVAVLAGDRQTQEAAMRLLQALEEGQAARQKVGDLRIRVVWLVSGLKREDAPAVPVDLSEVTAELARLGVDKLRLAAQVIVSAPLEASFQVEGSARLDTPCRMSVTGMLTQKGTGLGLEVEMSANREFDGPPGRGFNTGGQARGSPICSLRTQITTPIGHAVVVGVTPTEGMTSVFVVQVLRQTERGEKKTP